jgi:NTP pyrophosphatase (non-canonical NTP hydrolase)
MTIAEYRTHTTRTLPDLGADIKDLSIVLSHFSENDRKWDLIEMARVISNKLNYSHMALGLAGEIGELVECIGTDLKFNIDKANLGEEIGDLYWYLANYANMRNIEIPETLQVDVPNVECLDFLIIKIGELVDVIKRYMAYNKEFDRTKEVLLVCDVRLALQVVENTYQLDGADIRARNIAKLKARFPEKFSDHLAVNRDLETERKTLE